MQENEQSLKKTPRIDNSLSAAEDEIDLLEILSLMLVHWWKIAVATLLGALLLLTYANSNYVPRYSASAKLYINNNKIQLGISQVSINTSDLSASQALVEIYREFIDSHLVLDAVGDALAENGYPGFNYYNLAGRITTRAAGNTQMLYITSWDYDPETAITIINTLAERLSDIAESVIEGSSVTIIDPAYTANLNGSNIRRMTLFGALGGCGLAVCLIFLYYYLLNDQIQKQDWLIQAYPGTPQLGVVPDTVLSEHSGYGYYGYGKRSSRKRKKSATAQIGENLSFYGTEAYNTIRTNVKFSFHGKTTGHVIGVTSSMVGDGKSYTSMNLAYAMAKDNLRVLLIDGDMRKLTLNQFFNEAPKEGLSEALCGQANAEDIIRHHLLHENLSILFSGSMPPNPSELLGSDSMGELLEKLRQQYDYVLIDLPPVGSVIDAAAVSGFLDGMIVIARHDHTRKKYIRSSIRQLELSGVRLLGFVYNANVEKYSFYGGYYRRYYRSYYKGDKHEKE